MTRSFVRTLGVLALVSAAVISCDDDEPTGPDLEIETFTATLSGANERPSPNASTATGTAEITRVGPTLLFRVDVAGLTNPVAAHIHGPAGVDSSAVVRVNLCTATTVPCPNAGAGAAFTGTLATGSATGVVGMSLDSLLVLLRNGNAYVNVHTNDNTGGANTGPGDFAAGELRGQIAVAP